MINGQRETNECWVLCAEDVVALMFLFVVKNELATSTKKNDKENS
jgi:hypothetical protein